MVLFRYGEDVLERFPGVVGGVLHASGVTNGPASPKLASAFRVEQDATLLRLDATPLAEVPSVAAWRRTFSAFGVEPTRYRSAAEALLRRLTKHGEIPSRGALVDIGNLVSIRYGLPVAVFDRRALTGTTTVRLADGGERFTDLGSEEVQHPEPGEVVFVDDTGEVSARRWCWRQSAQSAARDDTTDVLVTVEGQHADAPADVAQALADLERLLAEYQPETARGSTLLSVAVPAFDVSDQPVGRR